MKCIKDKIGNVVRTSDKEADELVKSGEYQPCLKTEWKKAGRKYLGPAPVVPPRNPNHKRKTTKVKKDNSIL